MCVDVSKETLHSLIALILRHEPVLLQQSTERQSQSVSFSVGEGAKPGADRQRGEETVVAMVDGLSCGVGQPELDSAVVLSAVNILTIQMFQLLRGSTPAAVRRQRQGEDTNNTYCSTRRLHFEIRLGMDKGNNVCVVYKSCLISRY